MADLKDLIARLQSVKKGLLDGTFGVPAAKELEAATSRRIFLQGKATDGSAIGQYSTTPLYINPNAPSLRLLPKFRKRKPALKPVGKNGDTVFKNGKPHKTAYLKRGYLELRERMGRQPSGKLQALGSIATGGVNLNFSGSLAQAFTSGVGRGRISLGFVSSIEFRKAKGLESKYKKAIFVPSAAEIQRFRDSVQREVAAFIQRTLQRR